MTTWFHVRSWKILSCDFFSNAQFKNSCHGILFNCAIDSKSSYEFAMDSVPRATGYLLDRISFSLFLTTTLRIGCKFTRQLVFNSMRNWKIIILRSWCKFTWQLVFNCTISKKLLCEKQVVMWFFSIVQIKLTCHANLQCTAYLQPQDTFWGPVNLTADTRQWICQEVP